MLRNATTKDFHYHPSRNIFEIDDQCIIVHSKYLEKNFKNFGFRTTLYILNKSTIANNDVRKVVIERQLPRSRRPIQNVFENAKTDQMAKKVLSAKA